jgi:hypothetical protein
MSFSEEWTDWHLTPCGRKRGSMRVDGSGTEHFDPPTDRVATHRWNAHDAPRSSQRYSTVEWETDDKALLEKLLVAFGKAPREL